MFVRGFVARYHADDLSRDLTDAINDRYQMVARHRLADHADVLSLDAYIADHPQHPQNK